MSSENDASDLPNTEQTLTDAQVHRLDAGIVRSGFGGLLNCHLISAQVDRVVVGLPFRDEVTTVGPLVHGGAIAGLIDIAATAAFWATPEVSDSARGTTINFTVNYLRGAIGSDLEAHASVRRRGGSISVGDVSVRNCDGEEVASAVVTYKLKV